MEKVAENPSAVEEAGPSATSLWNHPYVSLAANITLLALCGYLVYKIYKACRQPPPAPAVSKPRMQPMKRRDLTLEQLLVYNGVKSEANPEGRVLLAVVAPPPSSQQAAGALPTHRTIFDVTLRGSTFYGPGGPYEALAGRDASRALGTFSLSAEGLRDTWDELDGLDAGTLQTAYEWHEQFREKYWVVGRLLRPGEEPTQYSDDEGDKAKSSASPVAPAPSGPSAAAAQGSEYAGMPPLEPNDDSLRHRTTTSPQ